jgi:hypothetical protein
MFELGANHHCRLECQEQALFEYALLFEQDQRKQTQRHQCRVRSLLQLPRSSSAPRMRVHHLL